MILMFCLFAGLGKQSGCYWFLSQWHLCRWLNFRPLPVMSFPNWVVVHLVDHNSDGDVIKGTGLEVALNLAWLQLCGSLHRCLGGRALLRRPIRGCQWEVQVRKLSYYIILFGYLVTLVHLCGLSFGWWEIYWMPPFCAGLMSELDLALLSY